MTRSAPRYDRRLVDAVARFDDRREPIAETVRRLAALAETLDLARPSYAHLRRYVKRHRLAEDELREILVDAAVLLDRPREEVLNRTLERLERRRNRGLPG